MCRFDSACGKILAVIVWSACVSAFGAQGQPIGCWHFDETEGGAAKDSSGGHHGKVHGARRVEGRLGAALEFDGLDDRVEIADTKGSPFDATNVTLAAWVFPRAYPKSTPVWWGGIVGKAYHSESTYGIRLGCDKRLHFRVYGKDKNFDCRSTSAISLRRWTHVAATYDTQQVKLYVDGRLDAVFARTIVPFVNDQSVFIGSVSRGGRRFCGTIDEVEIYDRPLSQAQIEALYLRGAGEESAPHTVVIPRADPTPSIDGKLDDPCWATAAKVSLVLHQTGRRPNAATVGRLCHDSESLYVAFECDEPEVGNLKARATERDGPVCSDDCVEVFVDPNCDRRSYCHFSVNSLGTMRDGKWADPLHGGARWDADWQAKAAVGAAGWTVELAVPFYNFDLGADVTHTWGINLCRERRASRRREYTCWSPTYGGFHKPERFGIVRGLQVPLEDFRFKMGEPRLCHATREGRIGLELETRIANESDRTRLFDLAVTESLAGTKQTRRIEMDPRAEQTVKLGLDAGERANLNIRTELVDAASGKKVYCSVRRMTAPALTASYFTRSYYTRERTAKLNVQINLAEPLPPGLKVQVDLDRDTLWHKELAVNSAKVSVPVDAARLAVGAYDVFVRLSDARGPLSVEKIELLKRAPAANEIKADRENLCPLVNGKPFFAIGLFSIPQAKIGEYARAGFNMTRGPGSSAFLDTAHYHGMMVSLATFYCVKRAYYSSKPPAALEEAMRRSRLIPRIRVASAHPAFFGCFWDEPGPQDAQGCAINYRITKEHDPYHAVWPCFWQPHGPPFEKSFDMEATDPYWCPERGDLITSVSERIDNHRRIVCKKLRLPFWVVPQAGFVGGSRRELTPQEQRGQTYLALIHGARGVFHWSYAECSPAMRETLKRLAGEMRGLTPVLLAAPAISPVLTDSRGRVHAIVKQHKGKSYMLCVNAAKKDIGVKFTFNDRPGLADAREFFERRTVAVTHGSFVDDFPKYQTRVYEMPATGLGVPKIEVLSETDSPLPEPPFDYPDGLSRLPGIKNPSFEEPTSWAAPKHWQNNLSWEYPELCGLDASEAKAGERSVKIVAPEFTLYSEATGYGWLSDAHCERAVDLGCPHALYRDCHSASSGQKTFRVDVPNGRYRVSAAMRNVDQIELCENAKGTITPIENVTVGEIDELRAIAPQTPRRVKRISFEVTVDDGHLDLVFRAAKRVADAWSLFSIEVAGGDLREAKKFDFGTHASPLAPGCIRIAAPVHPTVSIWTHYGSPLVEGGKTYAFSVYMKSSVERFPVRLYVIDWGWAYRTYHKDVAVGKQWAKYTASAKLHPKQERLRLRIDTRGEPGTLWIDAADLEQAAPSARR